MSTVADVVRNALQKYYLETEQGADNEHAQLFADDLFRRVFRRPVEDISERAGQRNYLPEIDPPYRDPIQDRVRTVVASAVRWWWDDDIAEMRADAAGRAVADMIELSAVQDAIETAKRGPQVKPAVPPEIEAAYESERRWQERRGRW